MAAEHLGVEEAIDIAMEAELKAEAFYAQAALFVQDARGRDLLGRLAAFERHHYQKLADLARSLHEGGAFIDYEPRAIEEFVPTVFVSESAGLLQDDLKDEAAILGRAIDLEKVAGERYRVLADETADPAGRRMFWQLVDEERLHQRILEDEFFSLSNQGKWSWSGLYGE